MSNRYSFYIKNAGVGYSFDTLDELKEFCDPNGIDIESCDIRLGEHCDSLTDEEYNAFYQMKVITDYHLKLFEAKELFEFQK